MMRILADENCDLLLVRRLRADGHDVSRIVEVAPGAGDDAVLELAAAEDRILLTHDLDFGLLAQSARQPPAIVLIRLDPLTAQTRSNLIADFFSKPDCRQRNMLFVLEPGDVRQRLLRPPE